MPYPFIQKLFIKHYKNLTMNEAVSLHRLNILIGPNCCGKSNFIALFQFLTECVTAGVDIGPTGFETALDHLGGAKILDGKIARPERVLMAFEWRSSDVMPSNNVLELDLNIPTDGRRVTLYRELLYTTSAADNTTDKPFYYYQCHEKESGKGVVSLFNQKSPKEGHHFESVDNVPINELALISLPKLLENSTISPEQAPLYKVRRHLMETVAQWRFYNANYMNLTKILNSEPKIGGQETLLSASGENLALILFNLSNQTIDFEETINQAMKTILPTTRRVRAIPSGRLALTIEWYFEGIEEPFYLNEMSDGAVRMLCWAIILNSPRLPPLLVIDEPELGIHVAWMKSLAAWIKKAARKTQVIVTTHSPDLLDHFTEHLENVLCFCREKDHFSPKPLSRQRLSKALEEGWQLGDLYRVGDPDIGGWPW
ncbi:MAG: AAA family ATPase [Candidatus Parabeggiatoa sp.]|nr:AAA family ATPase [Candidatus Parabeggiatoa sp.]